MKRLAGGILILLILSALASPSYAAEFIYPKGEAQDVTLGSGEQHDNAYVAGLNVFVNSEVTGDLFSAGRTILVNGTVAEDLNAAGESVIVQGGIGGDARLVGSSVTINNPVAGDVLVAAGKVTIAPAATIGKDLWVAGDGITVNAPINGRAKIAGGSVTINSKIAGDLDVRGVQLVFGPGSEVTGKVSYRGPKPAIIQEGSKVSLASIDYTEVQEEKNRRGGFLSLGYVIKILSILLVAWLLVRFVPGKIEQVTQSSTSSPWANLGIGMLGLIVTPILGVILLFTVLGWYLSVIILIWYILMLLLAAAAAAILAGGLILRYGLGKPSLAVSWQAAVVGVLTLAVLAAVPVLGPLAIFVLFIIALGGMLRVANREIVESMKRDVPPERSGPVIA